MLDYALVILHFLGLALGMSGVVERAIPSFGAGFRALAIATVAINEMVGPVLFKLALDRSGESSTAPEPSISSLEAAHEIIEAAHARTDEASAKKST